MERPSNEELYERYGRMAGSFAAPYAHRSHWLKADIMAEADVALFEAAEKFDWGSVEDYRGFSSYLKAVVKTRVRDLLASVGYASSGSRRGLSADAGNFHTAAPMDAADWNAEYEWDASEEAETVELIRKVAGQVLTNRQYEAFARYYIDGIGCDAYVAELMGIKRPAAQKLRVRAEERIRQELSKMELF